MGCSARMGFGHLARFPSMSETETVEVEEPSPELEEAVTMNDPSTTPDPEEDDPTASELDRMRMELDRVSSERDEMFDKLRRAQAEFENIRKRLQREKEQVVRYAASDTIQSLLPVVDDFERAISAEGVDENIKKGLELIHRRIFEVFSRAGLKEVPQHDTFDPNLHYAVDRAPAAEGQQDQQILDVYQKGYFFKDRLVRASMVKVAVNE